MSILLLLGILYISFQITAQKPNKIFLNIPETRKGSFFNVAYQLNLKNVWCHIINQSEENIFQITLPNCILELQPGASLDYETKQKYFVYMSVTSGSRSRRASHRLHFEINVLDANDEPPSFKPPWPNYPGAQAKAVLVNEISTPPGTRVFRAEATDPDATADLVYSWSPGREVDTQGRFYISPTTGVITTVGAAPFPAMHVYRLSIRVVDRNSALPEKSFADMQLLVYTYFQPVQFPLSVFTVNFSEKLPAETTIGRIPAQALNYAYDSVFFQVLRAPAPTEEPIYLANGATGSLKTKRTLDYQRLLDHSWPYLVLGTENGSHNATALMVVTLVDVDDNPPFFQLAEYNSEVVREDVRNDTPVLEVMPDDLDIAPENRRYEYSLSGSGAVNFYVVSTKNGAAQIRTMRPLRYDTLPQGRPFYQLSLRAQSPVGEATTLVRIRIQNVNRNAPVLNPIPPLLVFRDIEPTSAFVQVSASDADGSPMRFYFVDNATNNLVSGLPPFTLNATSGNVYVTSEPELKTYYLLICAEDDGSCPGCPQSSQHLRSEPMTLQVEVVDRNSHAPTFSVCPPNMTILELAPAGTVVGQVNATDEDDRELSKTLIKYSLIGNTVFSTPTNYLQIDIHTGVITNVIPLFRDAGFYGGVLPDQLYFTVKATDWGVPEYWNLCNFQLIIEDINNHAPIFDPASYDLMVERNHDFNQDTQTKIGHVLAIDLDQEDTINAEIFYHISSPVTHFTMDSRTGEIMVNGMLTEPEYIFTVVANNSVALVGTNLTWQSATVTVRTTSNSSLLPPQLQLHTHTKTFAENQVHIPVAVITGTPAVGADYSLSLEQFPGAFEQTGWSNSPPPFTSELVTAMTGVTLRLLSGSNFLYQRLHRYTIRIRGCRKPTDVILGDICTDKVLLFELEDVNNMVPQFIDLWLLTQISIPENSPNGTEVLRMFAVDTDTVPAFREVTLSLVPTTDSPKFTIQDGVLRTYAADLDHETKRNYVVQILAQDGAPSSFGHGKPNSAETSLTIHILDVNDNTPQFINTPYIFNVSETAPIGHKVGKIVATDRDDTSRLVYLLKDVILDFAVNSVTGEITVARRLDYEFKTVYNFQVEVTDGRMSSNTGVTVHVTKSNQHLPHFTQETYEYNILEETLTDLTPSPNATDPNDNPQITYTLGGYFASKFEINSSTGALKVISGLNRDKPQGLPIYLVSVIATNAVGVSYAVVNVTLQDVNDEYPHWPYPNTTIALPENTPANIVFARLAAPDADIGENAQSYYVTPSGHGDFQVSTNGDIRALKAYDYERDGGLRFYLPITATNILPAFHSSVYFSATGSLTVTVVDVNDKPPTLIDGPSYEVSVPESAPVGVDIFTFLISDPDVSDKGRFECVLSEPNAYFNVTFLSSIEACGIRPKVALVQQTTLPASQVLRVEVYDSMRLHSVQATVRINVTEGNDRPPDVSSTAIDQLLDGTLGPIRLSHIRATSPEPAETSFNFLLESRSSAGGMFGLTSVMAESAQLTLIGRLDRETLQTLLAGPDSPMGSPTPPSLTDGRLQWPLILIVSDQREPVFSTTTTLTLIVRTQGPLIPPASLSGLTVPNKAPVGTDVQPTDISAKDLDVPNQDTFITYSIAPEATQAARLFALVEGPSGSFKLTTKVVLDRDTEGTATVLVPVIAVGAQSRSATSTLTVTVTDSTAPNPDSPASGKTEVYIPEAWNWAYLNAVPQLPIAYMPLNERYPTDSSVRTFKLQPNEEEDLMFAVYAGGLLYLKSASPPGSTTVIASVSTPGQSGSTTTTLDVTVRWMDGSALINGLVFQVAKATADWFVTAPNSEVLSPRDRVVAAMANEIDVPAASITMFPLQTVGTSFNVFVGVHESPYQVPGRLVHSLIKKSEVYNTALRGGDTTLPVELATQVYGTSGPLVFACSSEAAAMAACSGRGCRSHLALTVPPPPKDTLVTPANSGLTFLNPGGTALGPIILPVVGCWCNGADPMPSSVPPVSCTDVQACLNGGTCRSEPGTQTVSCICPPGYAGPRCEQTEVYFSSKGFAWAPSIGSCAQLHISFLFSTTTNQPALLLYAGPLQGNVPTRDDAVDFLGLQLQGTSGLELKVAYNLGSGVVEGVVTLPIAAKLTDGNWHRVDIFLLQELAGAALTIMVDMCRYSGGRGQLNGFVQPPNLKDCIFTFPYKNGLNRALNVGQYPLQLGGVWNPTGTTNRTAVLTSDSFLGSISQIIVNGELWNLAQFGTGQNALPRYPDCTDSSGADKCAPNGVCRSQGQGVSQTTVCQCRRGFRRINSGECTPSENSVEVGPAPSYIQLTAKAALPSSHSTEVSFDFRTRSPNGVLLYLSGPPPNYYQNSSLEVRLHNMRVEVSVNLGDFNFLTVSPARTALNDGAWHSVRVLRVLTALEVQVDEAAGPGLSAMLPINPSSTYLRMPIGPEILLGARRDILPGVPPLKTDEVSPADSSIGSTCFRDLRINGGWYPLNNDEMLLAGVNGLVAAINKSSNSLDKCSDLTACPNGVKCPGTLTCQPTWKPPNGHICTCAADQARIDDNCYSLAVCSTQPCQNGGSCKPSKKDPRGYRCICLPAYSGPNCDFPVMWAGLGAGAIAGIVLAILIIIGLLIGLFVWRCRRNAREKLLPPDQDLRENVMPYFEGAGEADTRSFDLRKLDPTYVYLPRHGGRMSDPHPPAVHPRTTSLLPSYAGTMSSTFQNPADKTSLGRLLTERMSQVLEEPTGPPPDYTLDYGYEGGVSDAEEDLHEAEEEEEEEGGPSDLASLASRSQSPENFGEDSRRRESREDGTLCRAFDDLDRLPDPDSSTRLLTSPSFPPPPLPPKQQKQNTSF